MAKYGLWKTNNFDAKWGQVTDPHDLPRDRVIEQIVLYIKGGTFVGGTSPAWVTDAYLKMIKTVRVRKGQDVIAAFKPYSQFRLQEYESGTKPQKVGDGEGEIRLWFTLNVKEEGYGLDAREADSLTIEFEFNTLAAVTTGSPTGTTGSAVDIILVWGMTPANFYVAEDVIQITLGTASNEFKDVYKHPAETLLKEAMHACTDSDGFTVSDSVVSAYKLKHGAEEVIYDLKWSGSKSIDKTDYQLEALETGFTIVDLREPRVSSSQNELRIDITTSTSTGYVFLLKRLIRPQLKKA